ncbi:unnamed protein product [Acanthoscelides obtectus]|uniref:Uncharacterized protein n=1 Tax=Acanthoscelides obtectus TaxID=200917 RepID=A0A9P0LNS0_ACAOB|nr:unnamed protein product [Acanthoscelides obtectus]CAK1678420.1 hypothetical protein AOBTE_LOCUS31891 [Acanthoscelides obtectus]
MYLMSLAMVDNWHKMSARESEAVASPDRCGETAGRALVDENDELLRVTLPCLQHAEQTHLLSPFSAK